MINEIHESLYESVVSCLPNLKGLHVVGCPKLDHIIILRCVSKTPLLQSLSLTTTVSTVSLKLSGTFTQFRSFLGEHQISMSSASPPTMP